MQNTRRCIAHNTTTLQRDISLSLLAPRGHSQPSAATNRIRTSSLRVLYLRLQWPSPVSSVCDIAYHIIVCQSDAVRKYIAVVPIKPEEFVSLTICVSHYLCVGHHAVAQIRCTQIPIVIRSLLQHNTHHTHTRNTLMYSIAHLLLMMSNSWCKFALN